jgi:DNA-directed RNA polymerase subunit K/omega
MEFKKTGAEQTTITRDVKDIVEKTGNVYRSLSILAKRSEQINEKMKVELLAKLEEFATYSEELEEVFENSEQIEVSKFYERLPKPWAIAVKELLEDEVYIREVEKKEEEDTTSKPEEEKDAKKQKCSIRSYC